MKYLVVNKDYDTPDVHGPFETTKQAQDYAERLRASYGLPWIEATPENNEAWTDEDWYFGIVEARLDV